MIHPKYATKAPGCPPSGEWWGVAAGTVPDSTPVTRWWPHGLGRKRKAEGGSPFGGGAEHSPAPCVSHRRQRVPVRWSGDHGTLTRPGILRETEFSFPESLADSRKFPPGHRSFPSGPLGGLLLVAPLCCSFARGVPLGVVSLAL